MQTRRSASSMSMTTLRWCGLSRRRSGAAAFEWRTPRAPTRRWAISRRMRSTSSRSTTTWRRGRASSSLPQLARRETPPVVYVTGSSEMNVAVAALKAGAADFVPKTVGDDFLVLLGSALDRPWRRPGSRPKRKPPSRGQGSARPRRNPARRSQPSRRQQPVARRLAGELQANAVQRPGGEGRARRDRRRASTPSLVHKRLYSSGDVRVVALDEYLSGLLDHLEASMRGAGHGVSLRYDLSR